MDHRFGFGDFVIATDQVDRFALAAGGPQHLVDALAVVGDQGVGGLQDRGGGAVVLLQLHHRGRGFIGGPIAEILLEAHQNGEIRCPEAVDALVGVADHKHRAFAPAFKFLGVLAIGDQQLDQVVLGAVGVLVFVHEHVAKAAMPVMADLFVLA